MLHRIIWAARGSYHSILVGLFLILWAGVAGAQSNDNRSPYSRFGYGTLRPQTMAASRGMGNIGIGLRDGLITSPANPASYTAVDSLTFLMDVGVSLSGSRLSDGVLSDMRLLGNLDYLTMLFPLGQRLAMSAGVMPFSSTGYSFGSYAPLMGDTNEQQSQRIYSGQGHYNVLYLGLGARPLANLSVGVNGGFAFGHATHEWQIKYANETAFNSIKRERLGLKGFKADFGVQYQLRLDTLGSRSLVLGAVASPGIKLQSEYIRSHYRVTKGSSEVVDSDTTKLSGAYTLPLSFAFGVSYRIKNKLLVGADVRRTLWEQASLPDSKAQLSDQWLVSAGMEWQPNYRARSIFARSRYRFGLTGANSYLAVPVGEQYVGYYELGATGGVGLPLVDRRSMLNLALSYKMLMPKISGMVREQYLELTLGLTFNEGWFRKARVH
ncbi:MAG: hypothetical protein Q4A61_04020 [Porphyromonadaceae bacterium]|nr:hypothetical protein [Porphyromonadaceae bacterium]